MHDFTHVLKSEQNTGFLNSFCCISILPTVLQFTKVTTYDKVCFVLPFCEMWPKKQEKGRLFCRKWQKIQLILFNTFILIVFVPCYISFFDFECVTDLQTNQNPFFFFSLHVAVALSADSSSNKGKCHLFLFFPLCSDYWLCDLMLPVSTVLCVDVFPSCSGSCFTCIY